MIANSEARANAIRRLPGFAAEPQPSSRDRSSSTVIAALRPGAPMTPPPG